MPVSSSHTSDKTHVPSLAVNKSVFATEVHAPTGSKAEMPLARSRQLKSQPQSLIVCKGIFELDRDLLLELHLNGVIARRVRVCFVLSSAPFTEILPELFHRFTRQEGSQSITEALPNPPPLALYKPVTFCDAGCAGGRQEDQQTPCLVRRTSSGYSGPA